MRLPKKLYECLVSLSREAGELLMPQRCVYCGIILERSSLPLRTDPEWFFCPECLQVLEPPKRVKCLFCGRFSDSDSAPLLKVKCRKCRYKTYHFDAVVPLGKYQDDLRQAVFQMKRRHGHALAEAMAEMYWQYRGHYLDRQKIDVVVPVPMFWLYRFTRGINNPEVVARVLAGHLGCEVRNLLRCTRMSFSQRAVSMTQRAANIENLYAPAQPEELSFRPWRGKHALLVDDVLTTGSTSNEIARILKDELLFKTVTVAVIARARGQ